MDNRFIDQGKTIYDFLFEFYVKCPQCGKFAYVKSFPDEKGSYVLYEKRILTCDSCGYIKVYRNIPGLVGNDFPLWLEANCCENKLWAYNLVHLEYIEQYITATLSSLSEYGEVKDKLRLYTGEYLVVGKIVNGPINTNDWDTYSFHVNNYNFFISNNQSHNDFQGKSTILLEFSTEIPWIIHVPPEN